MKKGILFVLLAGYLVFPTVTHAAYALRLMNGNEITISDYWEKNHTVTFYAYGGTVVIPKSMIREIRPSEGVPKATSQGSLTIACPQPPSLLWPQDMAQCHLPQKPWPNANRATAEEKAVTRQLKENLEISLAAFRQAAKDTDILKKRKALKTLMTLSGKLVGLAERHRLGP